MKTRDPTSIPNSRIVCLCNGRNIDILGLKLKRHECSFIICFIPLSHFAAAKTSKLQNVKTKRDRGNMSRISQTSGMMLEEDFFHLARISRELVASIVEVQTRKNMT